MLAGNDGRPRRHADDILIVSAPIIDACRRQTINDGGSRDLPAITAKRVVSLLVRRHQKYFRPPRSPPKIRLIGKKLYQIDGPGHRVRETVSEGRRLNQFSGQSIDRIDRNSASRDGGGVFRAVDFMSEWKRCSPRPFRFWWQRRNETGSRSIYI
jgi:hypothetical protein